MRLKVIIVVVVVDDEMLLLLWASLVIRNMKVSVKLLDFIPGQRRHVTCRLHNAGLDRSITQLCMQPSRSVIHPSITYQTDLVIQQDLVEIVLIFII